MSHGFGFEVLRADSSCGARLGRLTTPHGAIDTPAFMPVGTQATVKAMLPSQVQAIGFGLILANTYHLAMRPGPELIARHGGLHRFMGWDGAILTDSGGFQVYSLAKLRDLGNDGVQFRSHIDGSLHSFTPEGVIGIEEALGSDIAMVLDVCPPSTAGKDEIERAMELSTRWAKRCIEARTRGDQAVFGIVQGGLDLQLRARHAAEIAAMPFEGIAIGGLSVGEPPQHMYPVVEATAKMLPANKPRYLMGVGVPPDLARGAMAGVDMFDCVFPTRAGRNGLLLTRNGRIVIKHAQYRDDLTPPDPDCDCYTCTHFTRAYLRHLFLAREILASMLCTAHNLHFYHRLMQEVRAGIGTPKLAELAAHLERVYHGEEGDGDVEPGVFER